METVQEDSISRIRNRDSVLGLVVPKILRILYARAHKLHGFGRLLCSAERSRCPCRLLALTLTAS
jgi:hypothetical protein